MSMVAFTQRAERSLLELLSKRLDDSLLVVDMNFQIQFLVQYFGSALICLVLVAQLGPIGIVRHNERQNIQW